MKVEEEVPRWTPHQTSASKFGERIIHGILTKLWHQSLVRGSYVDSSPNFGAEVWWVVPKWENHQTPTLKFGECIEHGDVTKLWYQSLVMGAIRKAKCLALKKVWCKNCGMFIVLTKIRHQILNDPTFPKKNSNINSTSFTNIPWTCGN